MKLYPCPVVGESNYQEAITRTHPGERAIICIETGNPFDDLALRVENNMGDIIGYIARSSWLREAIHDEGRGVAATIMSVSEGGEGIMGVVLSVTLTDDPVPQRRYAAARQSPKKRAQENNSTDLPVRQMIEIVVRSSNFPLTCTCGHGMKVPFAGVAASTQFSCPSCGKTHQLGQNEIDRLDGEMFDVIEELFAQSNAPTPTRSEVLAIRLEMGAALAAKKRGLFSRLFD